MTNQINVEKPGKSKQWYVVQAHSSSEKAVQRSLQENMVREGLQDLFEQILVPEEEVVEMKLGQRVVSHRKIFPGYVLVKMEMNDATWHLVKHTKKVSGFLGGTANKPTPISQKEVDQILKQIKTGHDKPRPKVLFDLGELVRIKDGPFADFNGTIESMDYDKNKLRVAVTIFGRSTPIELDFIQVEKI